MDREQVIEDATEIVGYIFETEGWTWYGSDDIPTIKDIRKTISYLVDTLLDKDFDHDSVSTGRITVQDSPYEPDNPESFQILVQVGDFNHGGD